MILSNAVIHEIDKVLLFNTIGYQIRCSFTLHYRPQIFALMKKNILLVLALFSFSIGWSQQRVMVRGRVIDKVDQLAVIGANVVEYDKDNRVINGTVCDINGDFVLEMKDVNNALKVVMIGYITKVITSRCRRKSHHLSRTFQNNAGRSSGNSTEKRGEQPYKY